MYYPADGRGQGGYYPPQQQYAQQPYYPPAGNQYPSQQYQQQPQMTQEELAHFQMQKYQQYQLRRVQSLQQEKKLKQNQMIVGSLSSKESNTNILDKQRLQELCADTCGRADVLEDRVTNYLADMVDQMVENIVDYSCMYAQHRESDTLEKEDVAFAVSRLFPEIARDHKVRDVQLVIDQQVNINHASVKRQNNQNQIPNNADQPGVTHSSTIGVGGQVSTVNYKSQLMRVKKEQEQQMAITNVTESLKQQVQNMNNRGPRYGYDENSKNDAGQK